MDEPKIDLIRSEELEEIAEELIKEEPSLCLLRASDLKIVCLESDRSKKKDNKIVFADCEPVPEKFKWATEAQFMITLYTPNISFFDAKKKKILVFRELLKIIPGKKENEFVIRDFDVNDFSEIIKRYGVRWYEEPTLFDEEK